MDCVCSPMPMCLTPVIWARARDIIHQHLSAIGPGGRKSSGNDAICANVHAVSSEQIDAPLLPPEPMAEPKSVRLGFVTGLVAVDKLQARPFCSPAVLALYCKYN